MFKPNSMVSFSRKRSKNVTEYIPSKNQKVCLYCTKSKCNGSLECFKGEKEKWK